MGAFSKNLQARLGGRSVTPVIHAQPSERRRAQMEPERDRFGAAVGIHPLKGKEDGRCNVTACQRRGAFYFNRGTNAYYCWSCAYDIEFWDRRNGPQGLFPGLTRNDAKERALRGLPPAVDAP